MSKAYKCKSTVANKINFKFLNDSQKIAWQKIDSNQVTFLSGPAGTAKTFLATCYAIDSLFNSRTDRIVLTRPAVEAGEKLGALPGDCREKLAEYLCPIFDIIGDMVISKDSREYVSCCTQVKALAHMRGVTMRKAVAILDEAQNVTASQMKMYLTRLGEGSKLIICGDTAQTDIGRNSALQKTAERLHGIDGVGWHEFSKADIVRHPLIQEMLEKLDDL